MPKLSPSETRAIRSCFVDRPDILHCNQSNIAGQKHIFVLNGTLGLFRLGGMSEMPALIVRPLRAEDQTQWSEMWTAYLEFYETGVAPEVYDSTFARLLGDDPRDFSAFVAEQGDRLVGLTHFLFHRHAWKIEDVCYLQDLYARPDCRGTGVGRALIEAVYDAADKNGTPAVYWLTQDFNETARKLYDRIANETPFIRYQRP